MLHLIAYSTQICLRFLWPAWGHVCRRSNAEISIGFYGTQIEMYVCLYVYVLYTSVYICTYLWWACKLCQQRRMPTVGGNRAKPAALVVSLVLMQIKR